MSSPVSVHSNKRICLRVWAFVLALIFAAGSSSLAAPEHHGYVFFGETPMPGAVVSAKRSGNELRTVTDSDGAFSLVGGAR
jgi:hypothetical protein